MKKFIIFLISFFLVIGCSKGVPVVKKESTVSDGISFKNEYENMSVLLEDDFTIEKENSFKYLNKKNISDVFNDTNIIFIGNALDISSRSIVRMLNAISVDKEIQDIYYLDSLNNFAKYEINVNGQDKIQEETELYNLVLEYLKVYNSELVSLSSPSVIFVKDGKIMDYYVIDLDLKEDAINQDKVREHIILLIEKLYSE